MANFPDIYSSVTDRIVAALEAGTPPWICPWHGMGVDARPANATTARPYRGINVLLLNLRAMCTGFTRNCWLTFQQAQAVGGCARRREFGLAQPV